MILELVGSNLVLRDKKLFVEAKKPLQQLANVGHFSELRAVVENIRTLYAARDPDFMKLLDGIRKLDAIIAENRSGGAAGRAA